MDKKKKIENTIKQKLGKNHSFYDHKEKLKLDYKHVLKKKFKKLVVGGKLFFYK